LDAIAIRRAEASLALLDVRGARIAPYEFTTPDTYAASADVLAVPEELLRLGAYLTQGFPEDLRAIREHLDGAARFLSALPVARDLRSVVPELVFWLLTDPREGALASVMRPTMRALVEEAACVVLDDSTPPEALLTRIDDGARRARRRDTQRLAEGAAPCRPFRCTITSAGSRQRGQRFAGTRAAAVACAEAARYGSHGVNVTLAGDETARARAVRRAETRRIHVSCGGRLEVRAVVSALRIGRDHDRGITELAFDRSGEHLMYVSHGSGCAHVWSTRARKSLPGKWTKAATTDGFLRRRGARCHVVRVGRREDPRVRPRG